MIPDAILISPDRTYFHFYPESADIIRHTLDSAGVPSAGTSIEPKVQRNFQSVQAVSVKNGVITLNGISSAELSIWMPNGKLVRSFVIREGEQISVESQKLAAGTYMICANGTVPVRFIVK